jgi:7-cyano-7-deazaguanine synthase
MAYRTNAAVLCSGGLDSVTTAYYVKKKLQCNRMIIIFFNYGQRALKQERACSKNCAKKLGAEFIELKLPLDNAHVLIHKKSKIKKISRAQLKNTKKESDAFYIPFRNIIFISHALHYLQATYPQESFDIFVGFKCEGRESYPDTTKKFVNAFNEILKIHGYKGRVRAPFMSKDKDEIILLGKKGGIDFSKTYSCYRGGKVQCGNCLACRLRKEAFYWANIDDPTSYQ